jgi:hypothetical protein
MPFDKLCIYRAHIRCSIEGHERGLSWASIRATAARLKAEVPRHRGETSPRPHPTQLYHAVFPRVESLKDGQLQPLISP